jgi:hypothetical protein
LESTYPLNIESGQEGLNPKHVRQNGLNCRYRCSKPQISLLNEIPAHSQTWTRHAIIGNECHAGILECFLQATARFQRDRFIVAFDAQDGALTYAGEPGEFSLTDVEGDTRSAKEFVWDIHAPIPSACTAGTPDGACGNP